MDDLAFKPPDGLVLLPSAGGYSTDEMVQQQDLINRQQASKHAAAQLKNMTFPKGVARASDSLQGVMNDWIAGKRSIKQLLLVDNRLQGLGLLLVVLALAGLLIDAVYKK